MELSDDSDTYGKALWNGTIVISRDIALSDLRWRTELHEALHHFSAGLTVSSYLNLPGWEEGVVEQLQRIWRDDVLIGLDVRLSSSFFDVIEANHQCNRYIEALEAIRTTLQKPAMEFYELLLALPLEDRPASIVASGRLLPPEEFRDFQRTFALAYSKLRGE